MALPNTTPGANRSGSPKGTSKPSALANVAKMVVTGQGVKAPDQRLDLSYLDNVVEAAPEGTFNVIDAVEVTAVPNPAAQDEPTAEPVQSDPPAPPAQTQPAPDKQETGKDESGEPDEFAGKSAEDLKADLKRLRTEYGRQSNEVGDYRKFFDQFTAQMAKQNQQPAQSHPSSPPVSQPNQAGPVNTEDESQLLEMMLGKPKDFLNLVTNNIMGNIQNVGIKAQIEDLDKSNSDLFADESFKSWLGQVDPFVLQRADVDPRTRQFVFNTYRAMSGKAQSAQPAQTGRANGSIVDPNGASPAPRTNRQVTVTAAAGSGTPAKAPPATFSRKAMRDLAFKDPGKYSALAHEYTQAINEGRVTD